VTPGQRAELMAPRSVCGFHNGAPLYKVSLSLSAWTRLQDLTSADLGAGMVPVWYYLPEGETRWWVMTPDPVWFVELEEKINAAREG